MNLSTSLIDALKQIVQTLQVRHLFPSTLLVIGSLFIFNKPFLETFSHSFLVVFSIVLISFIFTALNGPFIRFLEGYIFEDFFLFRWLLAINQKTHQRRNQQIKELEKELIKLDKIKNELEAKDSLTESVNERISYLESLIKYKKDNIKLELNRDYPQEEARILPTKLGNVLRAFEDYPTIRYGMDSIDLWIRMLLILEEKKFLQFISNEKVTFDFLINMCIVFVTLSVVIVISVFLNVQTRIYLFASLFLLVVSFLCYRACIFSGRDMGDYFCAAFDLYRHELNKSLLLEELPSNNLKKEKEHWQSVSRFILNAETDGFQGFNYKRKHT